MKSIVNLIFKLETILYAPSGMRGLSGRLPSMKPLANLG